MCAYYISAKELKIFKYLNTYQNVSFLQVDISIFLNLKYYKNKKKLKLFEILIFWKEKNHEKVNKLISNFKDK